MTQCRSAPALCTHTLFDGLPLLCRMRRLGPRSTQFTFRNLIFADDLVVFEQGNQPWSRIRSSLFGLLDEELEPSFGFLLRRSVVNLKSGERLVIGHRVETAKQRPRWTGPEATCSPIPHATQMRLSARRW